ncbi:hypothetical protein COO20_08590 [Thalassospira marina]|uniref:Uncharacterized protein n=1 Tax=Thalassospira marina TaxID=2048283 RepID=A0A2N3KWC9_9PROT|nr:hypothetical protein COO20_08590 [Thalassospira marina]
MALEHYVEKIRAQEILIWQTTSRRDMWTKLLDRLQNDAPHFSSFLEQHADDNEVVLRRRQVRALYKADPELGMVAAIIWTHARGIRVNALSLLVRDLPTLVELFDRDDFSDETLNHLLGQPGISVPTASKMLSACGKNFDGIPAAILDDSISAAIESSEFAEDFPRTNLLRGKARSRPLDYYKAYLADLNDLAIKHDISHDNLDRFLAEFTGNGETIASRKSA